MIIKLIPSGGITLIDVGGVVDRTKIEGPLIEEPETTLNEKTKKSWKLSYLR